jgi:hypothetical protein
MPTAWNLIASTTLTSDTASVTFSSITSTYDDLRIICSTRSKRTPQTLTPFGIRFNGNSGGSAYKTYLALGTGGTTDALTYDVSYMIIGYHAAQGTDANLFTSGQIVIPQYPYSGRYKGVTSIATTADADVNGNVSIQGGRWNASTDGISSITIFDTEANLASGSSYYLFGIYDN